MATQNTLSISSELMEQIEFAAKAADKTTDQWAAEAIQRQLEDDRWQKMFRRNERYARGLNINEADVPKLVRQSRLERSRP